MDLSVGDTNPQKHHSGEFMGGSSKKHRKDVESIFKALGKSRQFCKFYSNDLEDKLRYEVLAECNTDSEGEMKYVCDMFPTKPSRLEMIGFKSALKEWQNLNSVEMDQNVIPSARGVLATPLFGLKLKFPGTKGSTKKGGNYIKKAKLTNRWDWQKDMKFMNDALSNNLGGLMKFNSTVQYPHPPSDFAHARESHLNREVERCVLEPVLTCLSGEDIMVITQQEDIRGNTVDYAFVLKDNGHVILPVEGKWIDSLHSIMKDENREVDFFEQLIDSHSYKHLLERRNVKDDYDIEEKSPMSKSVTQILTYIADTPSQMCGILTDYFTFYGFRMKSKGLYEITDPVQFDGHNTNGGSPRQLVATCLWINLSTYRGAGFQLPRYFIPPGIELLNHHVGELGAFEAVWKGIKCFVKMAGKDSPQEELLFNEVQLYDYLEDLQGKAIPRKLFSGKVETDRGKMLILVTEFAGKTITHFMKSSAILGQKAIECLNAVHKHNVAVGDVRADNFVVSESGKVCLVDLARGERNPSKKLLLVEMGTLNRII